VSADPAGPAAPPGPAGAGIVGVGVDVCEVDRMGAVLARTPTFRTRVFTPDEREYCDRRRHPAERYAVRFAAKEAVLKAMGLGIGACALREIEVVRAASGAPAVALHGRAATLAGQRGIGAWHLSLTHAGPVAQAMVVATR
jgi:holo-[acyl-carrier protein] synthase